MDIRVKTKCPYCGHVNDTMAVKIGDIGDNMYSATPAGV